MNFQDLLSKMKKIDENVSIEECGDMPGDLVHPPMTAPKQSDSVTMNVSMNGSGAGGIRDLMGILKNIEDGAGAEKPHGAHGDDEIVIGGPLDAKMAELEDSYNNEPNPVTVGSNIVTGDDLASKGGEAEKVNGGGNPMGVDESLVARLSAHYESIKEGAKKEQEPEGTYSKKRFETDGQRVARLAKEKRQAEKKERMKNDFNAEMERE